MDSDFGSLNDLSLKAGVCLSVCISSKGSLHRYLSSLIHQSCAVWTSHEVETQTGGLKQIRGAPTHNILTHREEFGCRGM